MNEYLVTIPEGLRYRAYCENFDAGIDCSERLLKYIKNNDNIVIGEHICEVVKEFTVIPQYVRNMFIKLLVR